MAARKKKSLVTDSAGNGDPRTPLDPGALLAAARPVLKALAANLLERADASPNVTAALQERHAQEQMAERTADQYPEWRRAFVEQVAAAWLLSCVFVRTLEDRGLLGRNRIAGPGAQDSLKTFQQLAPSLSEREYLLTVFGELSRLPAATDLFDARHNPVWLLAPSAEVARQLLDLFRAPNTEAPTFRFGSDDTRFLGDLYQDLSEDVRKRFALLQTPRFVESFILDRTLEPAIERFGLDETNLIDPTCGSGHFLLGAFERLFDHRLRAQPGLSHREAATKALDAIAGADINPYAVAIARFRLALAFIEKCGFIRLKDVPRLPLHVAVADSLIYNPHIPQLALATGTDPSQWEGDILSFEDPQAAREVLFKQYAAVVGNPPYITVKDAKLRDRYRAGYSSAFREYSLAVPFAQRFFQLGRLGGTVGMITANSFMKREFGKKLIDDYFRTVNLNLIVNTSGAYIPGHGTPTVLLFGTAEKAHGGDVLTVLANRGEPSTPDDAERGRVWSSIVNNWQSVGFENDYISVARVDRATLSKHPWSLGGGGAAELKELIEERCQQRLSDVVDCVGFSVITGEDNVLMQPAHALARQGLGGFMRRNVVGEEVRDWGIGWGDFCIWPNNHSGERLREGEIGAVLHYLWPWKASLEGRKAFGAPIAEKGIPWWALREVYSARMRTPLTITFAFVATHNHFVLDRGGKVFKQSAPIIKLPETSTEDDHHALLAYLNSSTAAFYFRQVLHSKGAQGVNEGHKSEEWEQFLEYSGTQVATTPLPDGWQALAPFGRTMLRIANELDAVMPRAVVEQWASGEGTLPTANAARAKVHHRRMVALQEEIDWAVYALFDLPRGANGDERATSAELFQDVLKEGSPLEAFSLELAAGHRPFELLLRERHAQWLERNGYERTGGTATYGREGAQLLEQRIQLLQSQRNIEIIEQPQYKRRWLLPDEDGEARRALHDWALNSFEKDWGNTPRTAPGATAAWASAEPRRSCEALERLGEGRDWCVSALHNEAIPFLAALRHTEPGLEKRGQWEATWAAQRAAEAGHSAKPEAPPRYDQKDFREIRYFALRGKLDVPRERFISYPGCESDDDKEPVYGWAGWNHLQRAVALAGLYQDRKQREGWEKERLKPMLAGLLELLPWLKHWHNEPSAELGGEKPCDQFEAFLNAECGEFGFTYDDLRAWRPAAKGRAAKSSKVKKTALVEEGGDE